MPVNPLAIVARKVAVPELLAVGNADIVYTPLLFILAVIPEEAATAKVTFEFELTPAPSFVTLKVPPPAFRALEETTPVTVEEKL